MVQLGKLFRKALLCAGFAALLTASPAATAMPRIYIPLPPPPPIVEVRPAAPSPRHIWIDGYHRWDGHAYVWTPGRWGYRRGYRVWTPGRYVQGRRGWYWVPGHWRR